MVRSDGGGREGTPTSWKYPHLLEVSSNAACWLSESHAPGRGCKAALLT